MMEVLKDLWRSEEDRDNRQDFGIANENVRKLVSKDNSADKTTKTDGVLDLTIANMCDRMKIPLGKAVVLSTNLIRALQSFKREFTKIAKRKSPSLAP